MNTIYSIFAILFILFLTSCSSSDGTSFPCNFDGSDGQQEGAISDWERGVMRSCSENLFQTKSEIENNIIGIWNLVGYGHGWTHNGPKPCSSLTIDSDQIEVNYKDNWLDTSYTINYVITAGSQPGRFFINTEPRDQYLTMSNFCEDFMFVDATPADGNMYIYEKVE